MKQQQHSADSGNTPPIRGLIKCRLDSTSTISTLSIPAEFLDSVDSCPTMPDRMASIPRGMKNSERFRSSTNTTVNKAPPRVPGRRLSMTRPTTRDSNNSLRASAPPRIPCRQDTANKSAFLSLETSEERPGLSRMENTGGKGSLSIALNSA